MKRHTTLLVAVVVVVGMAASLLARPIQPYEAPIMDALSETGATVENWPLRGLNVFSPDGQPVTWAAQYRGRPLYLTFWAEWCDVCKTELPTLSAFAEAARDHVQVAAVCIDDDPGAALAYLRQQFPDGPGFDVLVDPGGEQAHQFATTGVPETFLIGPKGTVVARYVGPREFTDPVHQRLADMVARGPF